LETGLDRWLFCFTHLHELKEQPEMLKGEIFDNLFEITEINKLMPQDMEAYETSVRDYWKSRIDKDYYWREGLRDGIEEGEKRGKLEISKKLLEMGIPISDIVKATGLTSKQIRQIN
jgi:predicted transposase/invertase (TIGR01784 family)